MMKLTIITVTLNARLFLPKTLESILIQSIKPLEHIFIDGGSNDGTLELIEGYRNDNFKVKLISEKDSGIYHAMNKGLAIAKGEFVMFLNAGDYLADDKVLRSYYVLNHDLHQVYGSDVNYVNDNDQITREWRMKPYPGYFNRGWHLAHPAFIAKTQLLRRLGGFNLEYKIASDFDLMLRAIKAISTDEIMILPKTTVHMLEGGFSNSGIGVVLKGNEEVRRSIRSSGEFVTILYTIKRILSKILSKHL